jgi:hypothetical protein
MEDQKETFEIFVASRLGFGFAVFAIEWEAESASTNCFEARSTL